MLSVIEPVIIAISAMPFLEVFTILATVFICAFIAWQCLKVVAKGLGQLKKLVTEAQKPVPVGVR